MDNSRFRLIYLITIFSGAAGLMYEITWTRMFVVIFGNSSNSSVAVISAFLGGIAIGSYVIGQWTESKDPRLLKRVYVLFEFAIGLSAIISIFLLPTAYRFYSLFSDGTNLTISLLILRFIITSAIIFIPTFLMGGTIPVLVALLKHKLERLDNSMSLLYCLNTLGAVFGVLFAAFISIELFGIRDSIFLGAILNFTAGLLMILVSTSGLTSLGKNATNNEKAVLTMREMVVLICFFLTGLISIAYEILWSRVLAPSIGTYIYAFSSVLAIYLFGIFLGALIYNKFLQNFKIRNNLFALSQAGIGVVALISAIVVSTIFQNELYLMLFLIFTASIFMGISFPSGAFLMRKTFHVGKIAGLLYFLNTIGCISGGIIALFVFIPIFGSVSSIVIFAIFNTILALVLLTLNYKFFRSRLGLILSILLFLVALFSLYLLVFQKDNLVEIRTKLTIRDGKSFEKIIYKEDSSSSVLGFKDGDNGGVYVNGEGMTGLVLETRLMARIPIAIHPGPNSFLAICFGMGSTYRSARLHGLEADAVELSPLVSEMFPIFFEDADSLPGKGNVYVNDGRNYVNSTRKKYDIITVDPPPPLNAAGTTVLYSEDFYQSMKRILNKNGIVMEWMIPGERKEDILMIQKSFLNSFPYVIGIKWNGDTGGFFMLGSMSPIKIDKDKINKVLLSSTVRDDIVKFRRLVDANEIERMIISREKLLEHTKNVRSVTDNNPLTEYFALRYFLGK